MDYEKIFAEIEDIMHVDYAGALDKQDWPVKRPTTAVLQHIPDEESFVYLVQHYLQQYRDKHVFFSNDRVPQVTVGFTTRRYGAALYVLTADQEKRLSVGTAITAIDGLPIPAVAATHQLELDPVPERQRFKTILLTAKTITLADGQALPLHHFPQTAAPAVFAYRQLQADMGYVKMTNFTDYTAIHEFYQHHLAQIAALPKLITDVRVNNGGDDQNFYPLLSAMFTGTVPHSAISPDTGMQINATPRNYHNWQRAVATILPNVDPALQPTLEDFIQMLKDHQHDGLIPFELPDTDTPDAPIQGDVQPHQVVVLSDYDCGSAGDSFVMAAKKSPQTTIIGRATYGIWDYANVTTQDWDHFHLMYPVSRADWIDRGEGIDHVGVQPDIHLPWTPAMIKEDKDLAFAERFLNKRH